MAKKRPPATAEELRQRKIDALQERLRVAVMNELKAMKPELIKVLGDVESVTGNIYVHVWGKKHTAFFNPSLTSPRRGEKEALS